MTYLKRKMIFNSISLNTNKIIVLALIIAIILVIAFSKVRETAADSYGSLLLAESILTHQSVKLDHYGKEILSRYNWNVHKKNGHYYYFFPIGTSIVTLPLIALIEGYGFSMVQAEHSFQIIIATLTSILTFIFLIKLALIFLQPINAILISSAFWFGTSFASVTGTALWSHNFSTLFALISIYCVIKATKHNKTNYWPIISLLLFAAYLCRPTLSLLSICVLSYFFTYNKSAAIKATLLLTIFLAVFVGFSLIEFGQVLPDYYLPSRLNNKQPFFKMLYAFLLSPSKGLLIYSPFILLTWLSVDFSNKKWDLKKSWLWIGLVWPVLHILTLTQHNGWWGGWSFGPRFLTDILPGLFLLTLYAWPVSLQNKRAKIASGVLVSSVLFSIFVNTGMGLFNYNTTRWSAEPNIDSNPDFIFDWKYPQFLATKERNQRRAQIYYETHPKPA